MKWVNKMIENVGVIKSNAQIAKGVYKMEIESDIVPLAKPGQFVQVGLKGFYLRRPISISWAEGNTLRLVYKDMGAGTNAMTSYQAGDTVDLLGPLGSGFPIVNEPEVLILAGGVGTPPMLKTAKAFLDAGSKVQVILGFNTREEIFYVNDFEQIGIEPIVCTMDGSFGVKGTVLDGVKEKGITTDFVLSCGPLPMLRAVQNAYTRGYISLESRMGCGFGVCMGCVVTDKNGMPLRVCKNGPVFPVGKVVL